MTETLPAVTAAREARGAYALRDNGDLASLQRVSRRSDEALRDLLAVVDRLTAPPSDEDLWDFADTLLDAWNIEDENPPSLSEDFRDRFVARFGPETAVAASGRRHLPTETEWEYGVVWNYAGTLTGFPMSDEAEAAEMAARHNADPEEHGTPHYVARRLPERPAGPWEVCDEQ